ncbi:hypothetical protein GIB67_032175 [Kingdonia uniflora]|uniref:Uncharacterized protein n=1 Tax=Kingdonia uniflora TaxID=39325 RepID=A0A7J7MX87_9MAGN|nr:hypothetical protein GIB67_032175 [Kingdonia uniflora]
MGYLQGIVMSSPWPREARRHCLAMRAAFPERALYGVAMPHGLPETCRPLWMDYLTSPGSSPLEIHVLYLEPGILSYPDPLQDSWTQRRSGDERHDPKLKQRKIENEDMVWVPSLHTVIFVRLTLRAEFLLITRHELQPPRWVVACPQFVPQLYRTLLCSLKEGKLPSDACSRLRS